ncbi:MAG TPA: YcjF family protein [Xanthobacteraceae bacterium]|jgi:uncharacterized protein (DUF697 family)|nr:YcjF family protein [Xanthobacteraceae bacterium]
MTRKQLPKAINRTADNVHAFTGSIVPDEVAPEPAPRSAPAVNRAMEEPPLAVSSAPIANDSEPGAEVETTQTHAGETSADETPADMSAHMSIEMPPHELPPHMAARRRALAHRIVERHHTYAAVGGLVPVPVANIASVTAVNLRMVRQLSELYQVPFQRDRARAAIVSLIGGAAPSGFSAATSSLLTWIVPGALLVGLGVSALSAGALTRAIGQVFVESFENGAQLRG